ncbi:MAG TPA: SigE family RNA polymerase sigma factor [Streptosporangiaceae bacterium]|jgi:RNA polymerase sigma-70 factor (sigma-E family)
MESDDPGSAAALYRAAGHRTGPGWPAAPAGDQAAEAVAALYADHAVSLIRLAYLMLGDRPAAEDAVQDAFCGLYRNWGRLDDPGRALGYVRTAVLNGSRSALRRRTAGRKLAVTHQPPEPSAEASALSREEREEVMRAVRALPGRQREALVLRFYLDLPEREIARIMGLRPGSVRSATHRALRALGQSLKEA